MTQTNTSSSKNTLGKFDKSFGLQWHLTDTCDQRCTHCYIWRKSQLPIVKKKELSFSNCLAVIADFVNFCENFEMNPVFNITGGDPILFRHFWEILEHLKSKSLPFRVMGNPFHLTTESCKRLKTLGCLSYQMSLDGLMEKHDEIRKDGSFNKTLRAIQTLQEAEVKVVIMSTVSRFNYRDIPELARLVVQKGVNAYDFARYCPRPDESESQLSPMEYRNFLSKMWQVFEELAASKTTFYLKDHLWTLWLWENGLFKTREEDIVFQGCNCGVSHMTLLPDGTVVACRRFESPVGNILSKGFEGIFLGNNMEEYRQIDQLEGCKDCELLNYCRGCHAVSHGLYGSFRAKDPQCWKSERNNSRLFSVPVTCATKKGDSNEFQAQER